MLLVSSNDDYEGRDDLVYCFGIILVLVLCIYVAEDNGLVRIR